MGDSIYGVWYSPYYGRRKWVFIINKISYNTSIIQVIIYLYITFCICHNCDYNKKTAFCQSKKPPHPPIEPQSPQRKELTHREHKEIILLLVPNPQPKINLTQRHRDHKETTKNYILSLENPPSPLKKLGTTNWTNNTNIFSQREEEDYFEF